MPTLPHTLCAPGQRMQYNLFWNSSVKMGRHPGSLACRLAPPTGRIKAVHARWKLVFIPELLGFLWARIKELACELCYPQPMSWLPGMAAHLSTEY